MRKHQIDTASSKPKKGPDSRYFSNAIHWENNDIRSVKRSRSVAWLIMGFSAILAGPTMARLALFLPPRAALPRADSWVRQMHRKRH
jgi:type IV secretion system protein VirB8